MKKDIRNQVEEQAREVVQQLKGMSWDQEAVYADFLSQVHYYVCHTTRILALAAARFPLERQDLHHACFRHAAEEKSHEQLSLQDLRALGTTPDAYSELPSTKALYRSAYYLIEHESPVCLVGYAYFLEYLAVAGGLPLLEIVEPIYGAKATRHLTLHAKEDPEHIKAVESMVGKLGERELEWVREGMRTAAAHFQGLLGEIRARHLSMGSASAGGGLGKIA